VAVRKSRNLEAIIKSPLLFFAYFSYLTTCGYKQVRQYALQHRVSVSPTVKHYSTKQLHIFLLEKPIFIQLFLKFLACFERQGAITTYKRTFYCILYRAKLIRSAPKYISLQSILMFSSDLSVFEVFRIKYYIYFVSFSCLSSLFLLDWIMLIISGEKYSLRSSKLCMFLRLTLIC
jgi:hypothetical protein